MKQSEGVVGTGQEPDAYRAGEVTVTPLRKRRLSGDYDADAKQRELGRGTLVPTRGH
jgi:hypothetical protein